MVLGFVIGFALGGRSSDGDGDGVTAAGPSSTSTSVAEGSTTSTTGTDRSSTSTSSSTTSTTTASSSTSTSDPVATTVEPTTTSVVPFPTIPTTLAPVTTAPPVAPSRVVVTHSADGQGRLVIPRGGSASLIISNEGGLAQQWLVTGTGFITAGPTQGSLGPGQYVTVTLLPPPGELPTGEINGIASVLGAVNPTVAFVIPPA